MVFGVAFDGNSVLTWTPGAIKYDEERRQDIPLTVAGDPERIELWAQVYRIATGVCGGSLQPRLGARPAEQAKSVRKK
jgi:hypothetical protein